LSTDLSIQLRIAIARAGGQKTVAIKMGISEPDLSRKLSGGKGWKISELQKLFEIAELELLTDNNRSSDFELIKELARKLSETMRMLSEVQVLKKGGGEDGMGK